MDFDLTGGLPFEHEYFFEKRPEDPEMRDSISFRIFDNAGIVGLPRIGIEAVAGSWDAHEVQVNVAFPDGRVYRIWEPAPSLSPIGPDGQASVLAAGPLSFRCVEPFRIWTAAFEGMATKTSADALIAGGNSGSPVELAFSIEATMAAPPWVNGQLSADAAALLKNSADGDVMGGLRYEQLFRSRVCLKIGDDESRFEGHGLRVRRRGVRKIASDFQGGIMQSALFPSGRAFGYQAYPKRADGSAAYNEGFVFMGQGALIPARAATIPWMNSFQAVGEDVSCTMDTAEGPITISGKTVLSSFDVALADFPVLHQANVLYEWGGEQAFGMIERVTPRDRIA